MIQVVIFFVVRGRALRAIVGYVWVADHEVIHCGFLGEKVFRTVRADVGGDDGAIEFAFPEIAQSTVKVSGNEQAVRWLPVSRLIAQKRKFQRKVVLVLLDEFVDAAGVGFEHKARFWIEEGGVAFGGAGEAVGSKLFVDEKSPGAQDFRELAAGRAAEQIHLPEAVLRHDVALGLREIFH